MSEPFKFKQFDIYQDKCAMKVGTDSVLLGVFAILDNVKTILDIGTGTGLLALMMAQKYIDASITGVEIDEKAFIQASENIALSKFCNRINLYNLNILNFEPSHQFDLIICNPPYYRHKNNFNISDEQRSKARHDKDLPFEQLIAYCCKHLQQYGNLWLILPVNESKEFIRLAQPMLHLQKKIYIKPKPNKLPNRIIMCFRPTPANFVEETFTIYNNTGIPTDAYKNITHDFYLWKQNSEHENLKW